MARKGSFTVEALMALGGEKLAGLVLNEAGQNPGFKRVVSAALACTQEPDAIAAVIRRRLAALERARSFVDWEKRKAFTADLKATLAAIAKELGPADPAAAVEQLVRFLNTSEPVFERVDDSSGQIQGVYWDAARALPALAGQLTDKQKEELSERLTPLLLADSYGLIEEVVGAILPILPSLAIERLDTVLAATAQEIGPAHKSGRDWERRLRVERAIGRARPSQTSAGT